MPTTFAPVISASAAAASAASVTTTGITTRSGDLLIVVITSFANTIGVSPITDNKSNTWVNAIGPTGTTNGFTSMYYAVNCLGGSSHTFTFTPSSSDFIAIAVLDVQGAATSSALNQSNGAVASSTTHATSSISSGSTSEIFIGCGSISSGVSGTAVPKDLWYPYASFTGGTTEGMTAAFRVVDPSTSDTFSYTVSAARNEGVVIAGFKAAASASGGSGGSFTFFGA